MVREGRHLSNIPDGSMEPWRWQIWTVPREEEHMELLYGDAWKQDPEDFLHVVLLSAPSDRAFTVQLLIQEDDAQSKAIIEAVRRDLDYLRIGLQERNPWMYAQYHCTTASNWYSNVHWAYYPNGSII